MTVPAAPPPEGWPQAWLALVGLEDEARIAQSHGLRTVTGAARERLLRDRALTAVETGPVIRGVLSVGLCGALSHTLTAGSLLIADRLAGREMPPERWQLVDWVSALVPDAVRGPIAASDHIIADPAEKALLARRTGAIAVDMESGVAAELADRLDVPLLVLRAVSDTADTALPPAALCPLRSDGRPDLAAVGRSILNRPGQIPALIWLARDSARALAALSDALDRMRAAQIICAAT